MIQTLPFGDRLKTLVNPKRVGYDRMSRYFVWRAIEAGERSVRLPDMGDSYRRYWGTYIARCGLESVFNYDVEGDHDFDYELPPYTVAKPAVQFYGGGTKSVYLQELLSSIPKIHMSDTRRGNSTSYMGSIEGMLAIVGAGMGYGTTYLGIGDITANNNSNHVYPQIFERTREWVELWNEYAHPATVQNPVQLLQLDELLITLNQRGLLTRVQSCDHNPLDIQSPRWCGDCHKCVQIAVLAMCTNSRSVLNHAISTTALCKLKHNYTRYLINGYDEHGVMPLYIYLEGKYNFSVPFLTANMLNRL